MIVIRDPIGITSLYYGVDMSDNLWVSSEMKVLKDCFDMVNKLCKNDDVCLMIVFIFIGIMLCYLFGDRITGYANIGSIESPVDVKVESGQDVVIPNIKNEKSMKNIDFGAKNPQNCGCLKT